MLFAVAFVACGDDKKKPTDTDTSKVTDVKEKALSKVEEIAKKYNFEKVDNLLNNPSLVNISSESHAFAEDIVFEEVNILKTGEDTYSLMLVLDEKSTNFDAYNPWQIAIIATAKDPSKFKDPVLQKKGTKTNGIKAKTVLMGNEIVALGTFDLAPKEFSIIRFYLYDANGNKNTNYYVLKDVTIP